MTQGPPLPNLRRFARTATRQGDLWPKLLGFAVSWLHFAGLKPGERSALRQARAA